MDVTLGIAFFAGIVSFISPCVLPLVPAYIGYMGGRMTNTVAAQVSVQAGEGGAAAAATPNRLLLRFSTVMHGAAFVLGFTAVFVTLGVMLTAFVQVIGGQNVNMVTGIIGRIGGVVIIVFGLHFMGVLPGIFNWMRSQESRAFHLGLVIGFAVLGSVVLLWGFAGTLAYWDPYLWRGFDGEIARTVWAPIIGLLSTAVFLAWTFLSGAFQNPQGFVEDQTDALEMMLYADTRQQMDANANSGLLSSALMGVVFAAGWTPCIGPVYGAILTMSADTGQVMQAVPLLIAYSLGLGIPFLLAALMLDGAQGMVRALNKRMRAIKLVSGGFLVLIGFVIASGELQALSTRLGNDFADFSFRVEECSIGWVEGDIYFNQLGDCLSGAADFEALREANLEQFGGGEASAPLLDDTHG